MSPMRRGACLLAQSIRLARPSSALPRQAFCAQPTRNLGARHARSLATAAPDYDPSDRASTSSTNDGQSYRQRFQITANGKDVPAPMETFDAAGWPPYISRLLDQFPSPTPIQAQAWPVALQGRDMVAISATGSGKTLGYLLPAIKNIKEGYPPITVTTGPAVLILSPTRELAVQIDEEARKFGRPTNLRSAMLYGGVARPPQARLLSTGPELLIATPGRLIDMLESGFTTLQNIKYLVLDEADRMLDMGFGPQLQRILSGMPDHQTLMFSATWPQEVRSIAANYMKEYVRVTVGSLDIAANLAIKQHVEFVDGKTKRKRLVELLEKLSGSQNKVLIFVSTKLQADMLSEFLHADGWPVFALHGDKTQAERARILDDFRTGRTLVMIATDVASRGLDIKDITCVVNYDMPNGIDDYVHRIGRTGRAGRSGESYTFITPSSQDTKLLAPLVKILRDAGQEIPAALEAEASRRSPPVGRGGQSRFGNRTGFGKRGNFGLPAAQAVFGRSRQSSPPTPLFKNDSLPAKA